MLQTTHVCLALTLCFQVRNHAHTCIWSKFSAFYLFILQNPSPSHFVSNVAAAGDSRYSFSSLQIPKPLLWCALVCRVVPAFLRAQPPACPGVESTTVPLTGSTSTSRAAVLTCWPHLLMAPGLSTSVQFVMGEKTAVRYYVPHTSEMVWIKQKQLHCHTIQSSAQKIWGFHTVIKCEPFQPLLCIHVLHICLWLFAFRH